MSHSRNRTYLVPPVAAPWPGWCGRGLWRQAVIALSVLVLVGCAGLQPVGSRTPSMAIAATPDTELGALALQAAARAGVPGAQTQPVSAAAAAAGTSRAVIGHSGLRPMPEPDIALDARITLIRRAQSSLDLQYYLVGQDEIGHLLLRELRDAARRGVRVRLLMDDFYTQGMDGLLQGLAAHPNAEVRLFNPFGGARTTKLGRLFALGFDFKRLNHRMHNKMFIADGAMAIVGGRNMADGYFLRGADSFIDFDALMVGPVVPQLQTIFDDYWNSRHVYAVGAVAPTSAEPAALRADFEHLVEAAGKPLPTPTALDFLGIPPLSLDLQAGLAQLIWAETSVFADDPNKVVHGTSTAELAGTAMARSLRALREARSEILFFTPYFVPGTASMAGLKQAREHNISVRIVTNSMATTDEPLASLAYERHRVPLLKLGVELLELRRLEDSVDDRKALGSSRARWHAKIVVIDRKTVVLGSMNLDQRSSTTNTELGVLVRSPPFAQRTLLFLRAKREQEASRVTQVKLKPDGTGLQWIALKGEGSSEVLESEPDVDYLLRLQLLLLSPFVSDDLL
jgi:putative cardiolipin synthase